MSMTTIYLAGSIRDGNEEDINWREQAITTFGHKVRVRRGRLQGDAVMRTIFAIAAFALLVKLVILGGLAWVAVHFLLKVW